MTANDDPCFFVDYLHALHLAKFDPGVDLVEIYIAVSEVNIKSTGNQKSLNLLIRIIETNPKLKVVFHTFKSNVGRDFSSAAVALREIAKEAARDDCIMFCNRSAYGPLRDNWYFDYVEQYDSQENTGLCGSTINFASKAAGLHGCENVHVQTYVYLSKFYVMQGMLNDYPGEKVSERPLLLEEGELGLSKAVINQGFNITSLFWSNYSFNHQSSIPNELSTKDVKQFAKNVPYRYKFKAYTRGISVLICKLKWYWLRYRMS